MQKLQKVKCPTSRLEVLRIGPSQESSTVTSSKGRGSGSGQRDDEFDVRVCRGITTVTCRSLQSVRHNQVS